jgi:serine protease Do
MGIGFAIPTNMAKPITDSLKDQGKVIRGWLGVVIQDVDSQLAGALKLPSANGVLVSDVQAGSPAAKARLQRGDVVVKVDGKPVDSSAQLRNLIAASGAGKSTTLSIVRDGKPATVTVLLEEMPESTAVARSAQPIPKATAGQLDGMTVESLTPATRRQSGVPNEVQQGVLITRIEPGSLAARLGLRQNDVILEVNRKRVDSVQTFGQLYGGAKGSLLLLVYREGSTVYLVARR